MLTNTLVLVGAAVLLLIAIGTLIHIRRTPSMSPTQLTISSVIVGMLIGVTTNVGTYYLLKEADRVADTVTVDPIRGQITADQVFTVSGRATIADDRHELWVVVYRPSGGFDIANRSAIPVASNETWVLNLVRVGRPPEAAGQSSPDAGLTYTVSAVIVDEQGVADLKVAVESVPNPTDSPFVDKSHPSGVVASSSIQVTPL